MTTTQDDNHPEHDIDTSVKKLIWQAPRIQVYEFSAKNINSGDDALNENQAGNNFLSS